MKHWLFLLLPAFAPLASLPAQTFPCYEKNRNEGLQLMNKKNYKDAINQFWSTLVICNEKPEPNDLSDLIKEAQKRWVSELENAVAREQAAFREAVAAKEAAESAKSAEEKARKEAEDNARKAHEQGKKAESLRLSLLADMARQRGQKTDALFLSWMALQLSGPQMSSHVMRSFGDAVCDTFAVSFFSGPQQIRSAAYLPGGRKMLIETKDETFFIVGTNESTGATQLPPGLIGVVPSNTGNLLVTWDKSNTAQVINTQGVVTTILSGHREALRSAVFSPDDNQVLTCSRDNTARLWDLKGRQLAVLEGHTANVQSAGFASDGSFILTRASDGTARTWTREGAPIAVFSEPDAYLKKALIHPANNRIVILYSDGILKLYDKEGQPVRTIASGDQPVKEVVLANETPRIAIKSGNNTVSLIAENGDNLATCRHNSTVTGMYLDADGTRLLTWAKDRTARLWDDRGQLLREFRGHRDDITAAVLSSDALYVLTTSKDATVKLWDAEGNIVTEWVLGAEPVAPAFFSPDGRYFIATNKSCKSVSAAPFPMNIYRQVEPQTVLNAAATPALLKKYNVQYVEELADIKSH